MSQMRLSVGSLVNGSITAVSGSGMTSMSLGAFNCYPRIEEPSKPSPSSKADSSLNSEIGTVKCCHCPSRSMNLISTITAPFSLIIARTCFGVIESLILLANFGNGETLAKSQNGTPADRAHQMQMPGLQSARPAEEEFH